MSNKKGNATRTDIPWQLLICILLAILCLGVYLFVVALSDVSPIWTGVVLLLLYGAVAGSIYFVQAHKLAELRQEKETGMHMSVGLTEAFKNNRALPYAVVDSENNMRVVNQAFIEIFGGESLRGKDPLNAYCNLTLQQIQEEKKKVAENREMEPVAAVEPTVKLGNRRCHVEIFPFKAEKSNEELYVLTFEDVTELYAAREDLENKKTAVAYIVLDNLEDLAQYVRVSFRSAANEIEGILKQWAAELGGMIREYDRDKYIFLFSQEQLEKCVENKFEILENIRDVRLGDSSMPVTVSMGIAVTGNTLAERERDAAAALDLALQRGGDQVALRTTSNVIFFGGRTKTAKRRTRVRARVISGQLCARIAKAKNVLIMGHRNPDFDSVGACIGVARLCMFCGVNAKVVVNRDCDVFRILTSRLTRYEEYADLFVDGNTGLDLVGSTTLLIVVDTNNFAITEAPELTNIVGHIIILDHHRQIGEYGFEPLINYIDPSASSTCEMIAEILEQTLTEGTLLKEEANAMLTGIMLDTNKFQKDTGSRTFAAALYLQGEGANTEIARRNFEDDIKDFMAEASFSKDINIYRDRMAVTRSKGTGDPLVDRIAASKAADKLLTVRQVDASFALVEVGNNIHISARSNGTINVQLILEKLKGGGHFDSAGAQVSDSTMEKATSLLLAAIDETVPRK